MASSKTIDPVEVKYASDPSICAPIRLTTEAMATKVGFDEEAVAKLGLCVNEAVANVIRHAYGNRHDQPVIFCARPIDRGLEITLRDWGNGVDPSKLPEKPHDPYKPGGLGLICLRQMLDYCHFEKQPDGGILLTMRKILPP